MWKSTLHMLLYLIFPILSIPVLQVKHLRYREDKQIVQGHRTVSADLNPIFVCLFWQHYAACRILVVWPGIEPGPPQWKPGILKTRPPGKSQDAALKGKEPEIGEVRALARTTAHRGRHGILALGCVILNTRSSISRAPHLLAFFFFLRKQQQLILPF